MCLIKKLWLKRQFKKCDYFRIWLLNWLKIDDWIIICLYLCLYFDVLIDKI